MPQGSALGPLFFNIYLNDLFYLAESTNVCKSADDATFYACDKDLNSVKTRLHLLIYYYCRYSSIIYY